jgi:hypothetical protein
MAKPGDELHRFRSAFRAGLVVLRKRQVVAVHDAVFY